MACRALRIQPQQRNVAVTVIKDMRINCEVILAHRNVVFHRVQL